MDVCLYIEQFNLLDNAHEINCDNLSKLLYKAILNNFKIEMTTDEYYYFKEYQERVFDLIENARELTSATVPVLFEYLDKENHYLLDIVIMQWCLPRTDNYLSKKFYDIKYKQNIEKYNCKLTKNIEHYAIKNFCTETLIKSNNVPIHCIDLLWYYMNDLTLELSFYNSDSKLNIGFCPTDNTMGFGFNMEYLLEIGLGKINYETDPNKKGPLCVFLSNFVTNIDIVSYMLTIPSKNNYRNQLLNISKNPLKYFGDTVREIPQEVLNIINI